MAKSAKPETSPYYKPIWEKSGPRYDAPLTPRQARADKVRIDRAAISRQLEATLSPEQLRANRQARRTSRLQKDAAVEKQKGLALRSRQSPGKKAKTVSLPGAKKGSGPQGLLPGQHRNPKNGRFT